jgi:hypothetical protein
MIKKIAIGFFGLIVLLGIGGYLLYSNLDYIIKIKIEKYASAATQTNVALDSVKLALTTGDGNLSGLSVSNPKGFSSAKAFYLGSIDVKLDTSTLRGNGPIVIREMIIDKPQVTYELLNNGDSNLQAIQNNTQTYANSFQGKTNESTKPTEPAADTNGKKEGRKIIISDLIIRNGQVAISQEMLQGKQLSTGLPEIHLTNIGKASGGATAGQIAEQVFGAITSAAAQSSIAELAKEKITGVLQQVPAASIGKAAIGAVGTQLKGIFGQ